MTLSMNAMSVFDPAWWDVPFHTVLISLAVQLVIPLCAVVANVVVRSRRTRKRSNGLIASYRKRLNQVELKLARFDDQIQYLQDGARQNITESRDLDRRLTRLEGKAESRDVDTRDNCRRIEELVEALHEVQEALSDVIAANRALELLIEDEEYVDSAYVEHSKPIDRDSGQRSDWS